MPSLYVNKHPNALVGGGSGIGGGLIIVWLLGYLGVDISNEVAVVIAGGASAAALFIGRNGVRGLAWIAWSGKK